MVLLILFSLRKSFQFNFMDSQTIKAQSVDQKSNGQNDDFNSELF